MSATDSTDFDTLFASIADFLDERDLTKIAPMLGNVPIHQVVELLERLPVQRRAVVYRLLPKELAIDTFERLDPELQSDLIAGLKDAEVATIFADLDPDDRVWLLDELPATLAPRLLHGLSERDRQLTASVLGYPKDSIGRRMSPEYVSTRESATVGETMQRIRGRLADAETVYTLPVLDERRHVIGVLSLRDLLGAADDTVVADLMQDAHLATAYDDEEDVARLAADLRVLAVPIVDKESRLVGILTIDDAIRILEREETEDSARQGGVEPLRRPYFSTPLRTLVASRIVWLLVLGIGATLTVQVLSMFEATLAQVTVLALFVPLLIGTGGNTGNQAATTLTRAIALGDVRPGDLGRVLLREMGVGAALGAILGTVGGALTALVFEPSIGLVIGLTLLVVCTMAATIGGAMPMLARAIKVDPAVFSNPFITTFVDASGLIVYFVIAGLVLRLH